MIDKVAIMNEAREKHRLEHEAIVRKQAKTSFEQYKNDPLFVAGIMLYWAEGTYPIKYRKYQLALTNSDPKLLEVYCNFLRKYFNNIELDLRIALYTYQDINESGAKLFWSNQLKIPLTQFIKTQVLPSRSVLTKTKLPYGTCCVYLNSKDYCNTMQIWIDCMSNTMRK
ncbi:MAG: hypothetical protein JSV93_04725 [Candidatus Omnitrophota bacterium]|nr:MAG: hypothetical protein JSV93_04725 [Candidatus Omnitrophota bacterium]